MDFLSLVVDLDSFAGQLLLCCFGLELSCSSCVIDRFELLRSFLALEPKMEALIFFLILGDPMPPDIDNLMMFLYHLIQLLPLVYNFLLLVCLLHCCHHSLLLLLLLSLFDVRNSHEPPPWGCVFTDPSLHLCDSVVDQQRLRLVVDLFLCLRLLHGFAFLTLIEFLHDHQIF